MSTDVDTPTSGTVARTDVAPAFSRARSAAAPGELNGPSTGASVMLDIGPDTGALVVYTSETAEGHEIEIRPHGGIWGGTHTAVRARHVGDKVLHAGVFGSLPTGLYDLRLRHLEPDAHGHHDHGDASHGHGHDAASSASITTVFVAPGSVAETTLVLTDEVG
jgi:hypothetical protein